MRPGRDEIQPPRRPAMLRDIQEAFRRGVLDGDDAALDGLAVTGDLGAARRLGIHRNNCIGSLDSVLQAAYPRSEEHTSELQSLMRNSYADLCLKKKKNNN